MTIAACYFSNEGIVFGADSTASAPAPEGGFHYLDHNQKVFEIGVNSTFGAVTWGLGSLKTASYRTLLAKLADENEANPPASVEIVAQRWASMLWAAYLADYQIEINRCRLLNVKTQHDPKNPNSRTHEEEIEFLNLRNLTVGFCIAGYVLPDRKPEGFQVFCDPLGPMPAATKITSNSPFWGAPNMVMRLIYGYDISMKANILASGHWGGSEPELDALLLRHTLYHPPLPIRDAIDFIHACIYSTIKAIKFSTLSQVCGGPIELAVVTTDRPFRWVRHKDLGVAIPDRSSK